MQANSLIKLFHIGDFAKRLIFLQLIENSLLYIISLNRLTLFAILREMPSTSLCSNEYVLYIKSSLLPASRKMICSQ